MTLWHPDTCDCQIEISDDPKTRGQTVRNVVTCKIHQELALDHAAVLEENRTKNKVCSDVESTVPGVNYSWSMDDNRAVVISVPGATALTKSNLTTALSKYGTAAKVV